MGVGDWKVEISKPIDCKKWSFVALFFIQRMALVNGILIARPIVRKRAFVVLFFVFNSQNEVNLWNKTIKKKKADLSIMRKEPFVWIMLIIWGVGSYFFTIAMPNPVVYYQKGRGKVSGYQQIAASACFICMLYLMKQYPIWSNDSVMLLVPSFSNAGAEVWTSIAL